MSEAEMIRDIAEMRDLAVEIGRQRDNERLAKELAQSMLKIAGARAERAEAERGEAKENYRICEIWWRGQMSRADKAEARAGNLSDDVEHWKTEHAILADRLRGKVHPLDNGVPVDGPEQPDQKREGVGDSVPRFSSDWDDLGEECGFSPLSCPTRERFIAMVRWTIEDAQKQPDRQGGGTRPGRDANTQGDLSAMGGGE